MQVSQTRFKKNGIQIWTSPLEDGSIPVRLFNVANYGKIAEKPFPLGR